MRDVGGRVEVFRFDSIEPTPATSSRTTRSAGCTASPTMTEKKWHDLFDKSIKCLKAGNGGRPARPLLPTPPACTRWPARRAALGPAKKKLVNGPVAATGHVVAVLALDAPSMYGRGGGRRDGVLRLCFVTALSRAARRAPHLNRQAPSAGCGLARDNARDFPNGASGTRARLRRRRDVGRRARHARTRVPWVVGFRPECMPQVPFAGSSRRHGLRPRPFLLEGHQFSMLGRSVAAGRGAASTILWPPRGAPSNLRSSGSARFST